MHPYDQESEKKSSIGVAIVVFKIGICIGLLFLGVHITLWTIDTVTQLLNHPENIGLINRFFDLNTSQLLIDITINNEKIVIRDPTFFRWVVLILILIVLFNVIGRIIGGIFSCVAAILGNLNFDSLKSERNNQ
ncbi:MAG: hypothetical protein D6B25_19325 [Desulfobulbaceae bacterium]|nr:MAG: hypothetical protein D6B25_19325 [Desulfobulbaceae bacterium]